MTLRLHTGGLYLTNYLTSEGYWLHQILFRGFKAKGVNRWECTTFQLLFLFQFTDWTIWCMSITLNLKRNPLKWQVVMQQNRKNAMVDEYFARHTPRSLWGWPNQVDLGQKVLASPLNQGSMTWHKTGNSVTGATTVAGNIASCLQKWQCGSNNAIIIGLRYFIPSVDLGY